MAHFEKRECLCEKDAYHPSWDYFGATQEKNNGNETLRMLNATRDSIFL